MDRPDIDRLDALERQTADLAAEVARLRGEVARLTTAAPVAPRSARPVARRRGLPAFDAETVVGRVGVVVLLVGVAFLLRWGADQGWLSPAMRFGAVAVLGGGLLAAGLALRAREAFGALLAGGGLAALYGALFAAFQLYGLVGLPVGLALAALLTGGAFALALRTRAPVLAVVGVLGAVGAPALMYRDAGSLGSGSLSGALAFLALALVGGGALWWRAAWRSLLVALTVGGWAALVVVRLKSRGMVGGDALAFTLATLAALAATTALALLRPPKGVEGDLAGAEDAASDAPDTGAATGAAPPDLFDRLPSLLRPRALALWMGPVAACGLVVSAWRMGGTSGAVVMAVGAGIALALSRVRPRAAEALTLAAAALAGWAVVLAVEPDAVWIGAVVALSALAGWDARRRGDASLPALATVSLAAWTALLVVLPSTWEGPRAPVLTAAALALAALAFVLTAAPPLGTRARRVAVVCGHVLVLLAVHVAFHAVPGGIGLVAGLWGLYAVFLIVAGLRTGRADLRWLGLSTLTATLVKLLVLDLPDVSMAARVAVFIGLGAVLLGVAYLAPRLGKTARETDPAP